MPTLDERVAYLEGRFEEHAGTVTSLRDDVQGLRRELQVLRGEFNGLRGEFNGLRGEFNGLRGEFNGLRGEFQGLRADTSRHFTWLVGIQVATLLAIVTALLRSP